MQQSRRKSKEDISKIENGRLYELDEPHNNYSVDVNVLRGNVVVQHHYLMVAKLRLKRLPNVRVGHGAN